MQDKKPPLSDDAVLTLVEQKVKQGVGWFDSRLSKERERVIQYYNSQLPKRQSEGRSSYISTDVYDAVESMKAQLTETFAGNPDSLVSFPPLNQNDVESCRIATEYCSYQVWQLNDAHSVFLSSTHDGLTARVGITKVFWEKIEDFVDEELDGASFADAQALAARDDVTELNAEVDDTAPQQDPANPVFKGTLRRKIDRSKVTLLPVPPEEFVIEQRAPSIEKAGLVSQRTLKTRSELKAEGYDKKKVDAIAWSDARSLDLTGEQQSRNQPLSDGTAPLDDAVQTELQKVMLYETYIRMDMGGDKAGTKLWKVCHAGNTLLDKEEVDRVPFKAFIPLPIPHVFHGNNFAARVIPTQNARTVLTRAILDHASVTTNPRWGVINNGLVNPKEMLDNRLGGLVNMRRADAVQPLAQHNLNPYLFQTLEMLKQNKEESTGISALSQGLNKDAISTQNSSALVDNLVTLSQQRQKIIARNFADYLVQIYLEVYRLVLENEKKQRIIEVAGSYQPVSVENWAERTTCKVALHLGYGERDRQAAKFSNAHQMLDKTAGPLYQPKNRFALITDGLKAAGFDNWAKYITPPEQTPPQQPDPLKVRELDIRDKLADASTTSAQATVLKTERQAEVAQIKEQLQQLKLHIETMMKTREQDRQDADVQNRINVSQREMTLLEHAPPAAEKAIVSP